jgi:hypothetical protein
LQGLDWGGAGEGELGAGERGEGRGEGWHAEMIKMLDFRERYESGSYHEMWFGCFWSKRSGKTPHHFFKK